MNIDIFVELFVTYFNKILLSLPVYDDVFFVSFCGVRLDLCAPHVPDPKQMCHMTHVDDTVPKPPDVVPFSPSESNTSYPIQSVDHFRIEL